MELLLPLYPLLSTISICSSAENNTLEPPQLAANLPDGLIQMSTPGDYIREAVRNVGMGRMLVVEGREEDDEQE